VVAVSEADSFRCDGIAGGDGAALPDVHDLIVRAQRLGDTPRPDHGYPLKWYVEASLIGDMTAITTAVLHSQSLQRR
jgi:hypothetical protein